MNNDFVKQLLEYVDKDIREQLHMGAFREIASVFYNFLQESMEKNLKWVCNAAPGHGKTTVLKALLKYLSMNPFLGQKIGLLIVLKDLMLMDEIYKELKAFNKRCSILVHSSNVTTVIDRINKYQFVFITHQRLKDLALGFGEIDIYSIWDTSSFLGSRDDNQINKIKRLLIIDEKPLFVNSVTFELSSGKNNVVDWVDDLIEPLGLNSYEAQQIKSHISLLVNRQLRINQTTITGKLLNEEEKKHNDVIYLFDILVRMEEENKGDFKARGSLIKLRIFKQMCIEYGVGRIDEYKEKQKKGRKIIVGKRINYPEIFNLSTLILDGTAHVTKSEYIGYAIHEVTNYINYERLTLWQREINTSKQSREKAGHPVQNEIINDISKLNKQGYNDLFILPMKSDLPIYLKEGIIKEKYRDLFKNKVGNGEETNPVNLLNTTGKNFLNEINVLYLTSLPRFHPDFYKEIAISLYGQDVSLGMGDIKDQWFNDEKLENIYQESMSAEILQIIHRGNLRNLKSMENLIVFISNNDKKILNQLNNKYLKGQAHLKFKLIQDKYKIKKKALKYAEQVREWYELLDLNSKNKYLPCKIGDIDKLNGNGLGERLRKFLNKHWNNYDKRYSILDAFKEYELKIYESKNKTKMIKIINKKE